MSVRTAVASAAAAAAALALAGCQTDHSGTTHQDRSTTTMQSGMAAPAGVPSGARVVAQGRDNLMYMTTAEGTVYVYDGTARRVVWSGPARARANVVVDPAADAVTVNDQQAGTAPNPANQRHIDLDPTHDYQMWFATR